MASKQSNWAYSGWLVKRAISGKNSWKKRFFGLDTTAMTLSYFTSEPKTTTAKPKGTIQLDHTTRATVEGFPPVQPRIKALKVTSSSKILIAVTADNSLPPLLGWQRAIDDMVVKKLAPESYGTRRVSVFLQHGRWAARARGAVTHNCVVVCRSPRQLSATPHPRNRRRPLLSSHRLLQMCVIMTCTRHQSGRWAGLGCGRPDPVPCVPARRKHARRPLQKRSGCWLKRREESPRLAWLPLRARQNLKVCVVPPFASWLCHPWSSGGSQRRALWWWCCGALHCTAVKELRVFGWGAGDAGQCGDGRVVRKRVYILSHTPRL